MDGSPVAGEGCDFAVTLDVTDLDRTCGFYERALGFRVVAVEREGEAYERRTLRSGSFPRAAIQLRSSYRRPAFGSAFGTMVCLSLRVDDVSVFAEREEVASRPAELRPPGLGTERAVRFLDPDGYVIELFEGDSPTHSGARAV